MEPGPTALAYDVPDGISGELALWASHPDVGGSALDQTTVGIYRMFVLPQYGDIRMSKNDTYTHQCQSPQSGRRTA